MGFLKFLPQIFVSEVQKPKKHTQVLGHTHTHATRSMLCSTSFLSRWAGYGKSSLWPFRQVDGPSARSFSAYPEAKIPSNFKVVRNENDRGRFVVLLGWLHARPPQLEKYSKLWQDKGFSFIQVVPPDTKYFLVALDCFCLLLQLTLCIYQFVHGNERQGIVHFQTSVRYFIHVESRNTEWRTSRDFLPSLFKRWTISLHSHSSTH